MKCGKKTVRRTIDKESVQIKFFNGNPTILHLRIMHCHTCHLHDEFYPRFGNAQEPVDDFNQLWDRMRKHQLATA